jgi:hypothetical protein
MEAKPASGTQSRTERADFQATADPALNEAADRTADIKLLESCGRRGRRMPARTSSCSAIRWSRPGGSPAPV